MKPMTELELVQLYGEKEAEKVMAHKVAQGLYEADVNLPGKKLYLMMRSKRRGLEVTSKNDI